MPARAFKMSHLVRELDQVFHPGDLSACLALVKRRAGLAQRLDFCPPLDQDHELIVAHAPGGLSRVNDREVNYDPMPLDAEDSTAGSCTVLHNAVAVESWEWPHSEDKKYPKRLLSRISKYSLCK